MDISVPPHPQSLLGMLATLPDPRRRQGRMYPLASILGLLVLAALNGERSLRGMWLWGCTHWSRTADDLGFFGVQHPPALTTLWYVLTRLDLSALETTLQNWAMPWLQREPQGWSIDGKVLRGSKRADQAALGLLGMVAHTLQGVLRQQPIRAGDEVSAAVHLLRQIPPVGHVVTMDAGLLQRDVVQAVLDGGGDYVGLLKGNHSDVKPLVNEWIAEAVFSPRYPSAS
jgi:hypothetical protein